MRRGRPEGCWTDRCEFGRDQIMAVCLARLELLQPSKNVDNVVQHVLAFVHSTWAGLQQPTGLQQRGFNQVFKTFLCLICYMCYCAVSCGWGTIKITLLLLWRQKLHLLHFFWFHNASSRAFLHVLLSLHSNGSLKKEICFDTVFSSFVQRKHD